MRRFMSDPEYILACAYAAGVPMEYKTASFLRAVTAFANLSLAYVERGEDCAAMQEHADANPGSTLADRLVEAGACDDGLSVVGPNITEDTLAIVLAVRHDWAAWYNDNDELCYRDDDTRGDDDTWDDEDW